METDKPIFTLPPSAIEGVKENVFVMKNTFSEHGNEMEEIISKKPPFFVRWGTVFFLFFLLLVALICWLIKYPELVNIKAKLTSINAPKVVITKTAGKLIKLFAKEGERTRTGTLLGYVESTANHEEVIKLSADIDSLQFRLNSNDIIGILPYLSTAYLNLGEMQQVHQNFQQSFTSFSNYITGGFYLSKKNLLSKDFAFLQKMHGNLLQQKDLNEQDLELTQKTFNANQYLKDDKVISDLDYRNEQSKLINKKLMVPQINSAIINNESQQNEKQKEIMELDNTIAQQKNIFSQAINTLKSQAEDWKKKYLLTATADGEITFASFLQENQQLQANQIICFINPGNTTYYAEVFIRQSNFGKVQTGQKVLLKFPSYPFEQYGSVQGKIDFISNLPTDSGYLAKVILPNGLHTSHQKQIQFREGLQAQGEIITADMRLLERFYFNIIRQIGR